MALVLGTMGLPHIIVRFHTSPDGRSARRTAAITVALLSAFYLFPVRLRRARRGAGAGAVPLRRHRHRRGGPARAGRRRAGRRGRSRRMLSAGAFAAFLATSLGLLLALSSAVAHDLLPGAGLRRLRLAPLAGAVVIVALALPAVNIDVGVLVTSAFAVAAATFCPLLVLGIWWPRLTAPGAVAGVVVGLVASVGAIGVDLFLGAARGPRGEPARPARAVDGAAGVRGDGRGVAARPAAGLGRGGHAAAASRRGNDADRSSAKHDRSSAAGRAVGRCVVAHFRRRVTAALLAMPPGQPSARRHPVLSTTDPAPPPEVRDWEAVQSSPEFQDLRHRLRSFVFPVTGLFLALVPALRAVRHVRARLHVREALGQHHRRPASSGCCSSSPRSRSRSGTCGTPTGGSTRWPSSCATSWRAVTRK